MLWINLKSKLEKNMKAKRIILFIISILLLVIFLQNTQEINFHILLWKISMPQIFLLLIVSVASCIIGYVGHMILGKSRN